MEILLVKPHQSPTNVDIMTIDNKAQISITNAHILGAYNCNCFGLDYVDRDRIKRKILREKSSNKSINYIRC